MTTSGSRFFHPQRNRANEFIFFICLDNCLARNVRHISSPRLQSFLMPGIGREDFPGFFIPDQAPGPLSNFFRKQVGRAQRSPHVLLGVSELKDEGLLGLLKRLCLLAARPIPGIVKIFHSRR
jgi:hypothetical protein